MTLVTASPSGSASWGVCRPARRASMGVLPHRSVAARYGNPNACAYCGAPRPRGPS